jgi:hypothetical protein
MQIFNGTLEGFPDSEVDVPLNLMAYCGAINAVLF